MKIEIHDPNTNETFERDARNIDTAINDYLREISDQCGDGPFSLWARETGEPLFRVYKCTVTVVTTYDIDVRLSAETRSLAQDDDR